VTCWIAQLAAAVILGQTLFFKFSGAPEAVALFEKLGVEPWGRIGLGVVELVTVVALLVPRTAALGGLLAVGLMVGAIGSHLIVLGVSVSPEDGGTLFIMAWVTLFAGAAVAWLRRGELPYPQR
jgi:putative oxidoreductase